MKKYLLDTSLVAGYLLNRVRAIELVSPLIEREEAATSILVYGEVVEYVKGFPNFPTHRDNLQALLESHRLCLVVDLPTRQYSIILPGSRSRRTLETRKQEYQSRRFRSYSILQDEYSTFRRFCTRT